jgi:hypothetical protein
MHNLLICESLTVRIEPASRVRQPRRTAATPQGLCSLVVVKGYDMTQIPATTSIYVEQL